MILVATNGAFRASSVSHDKLTKELWKDVELTSRPELLLIRLSRTTTDPFNLVQCLQDLYRNGWPGLTSEDKEWLKCWFRDNDVIYSFDSSTGTWVVDNATGIDVGGIIR